MTPEQRLDQIRARVYREYHTAYKNHEQALMLRKWNQYNRLQRMRITQPQTDVLRCVKPTSTYRQRTDRIMRNFYIFALIYIASYFMVLSAPLWHPTLRHVDATTHKDNQ